MTLPWEAVSALSALASTLVVGIAAIAALLQIRHLRTGNQVQAILRIYDRFNERDMIEARGFVLRELPVLLGDPAYRRRFLEGDIDARVRMVANFLNGLGGLVIDGFLDAKLVAPFVPIATQIWTIVEPMTREMRKVRYDPIWADLEYVTTLEAGATRERLLRRFPPAFRRRLWAELSAGDGGEPG